MGRGTRRDRRRERREIPNKTNNPRPSLRAKSKRPRILIRRGGEAEEGRGKMKRGGPSIKRGGLRFTGLKKKETTTRLGGG